MMRAPNGALGVGGVRLLSAALALEHPGAEPAIGTKCVGVGLGRRMRYAGIRLDATQAPTAGPVDEIVVSNDLHARETSSAEAITGRSWRALGAYDARVAQLSTHHHELRHRRAALLFERADIHERMTAFLDRRTG